jgi:aminoglycoside 6-adenylyltransferase
MDGAEALLAAVAGWGRERADVQAVLVIGSRARTIVPADHWSDTDVVLVVDEPAPYAASPAWLEAFGRPLLTFLEPTAVGPYAERRVLFEAGQEVDFALVPVAGVRRMARQPELATVLRRGFRALVDKAGLEAELRAAMASPATPEVPDQAAFAQLTHDFWYHLLWATKKLRRGELWIAKQSCDCHLKGLLVTLLAWHTRAGDPEVDTWHGGRFLERWADPGAVAALGRAYARFEEEEVLRGLRATADLFERVERECAERLGLLPSVRHDLVRQRWEEILAWRPGAAG